MLKHIDPPLISETSALAAANDFRLMRVVSPKSKALIDARDRSVNQPAVADAASPSVSGTTTPGRNTTPANSPEHPPSQAAVSADNAQEQAKQGVAKTKPPHKSTTAASIDEYRRQYKAELKAKATWDSTRSAANHNAWQNEKATTLVTENALLLGLSREEYQGKHIGKQLRQAELNAKATWDNTHKR